MKKIVIVDDQPMMGNIYRAKFMGEGFQVEIAVDGEQALELIPRSKPDVVLLDLMLPKIDGLEVLKRIRANSELKTLPIIVFSASARPAMVEDAFAAGATQVLSKNNTSPKQVVEMVQQTLASSTRLEPGPAPVIVSSSASTGKATVVVFDQNDDMRALLAVLLRRDGYRVLAAACESDVTESHESYQADLFLLHADSTSATALVREVISRFGAAPVAAYSTTANAGQRSEIIGDGASLFINTPEELLNISEILAHLKPKLQQRAA